MMTPKEKLEVKKARLKYTMHPTGASWIFWLWYAVTLKKCWDCKWGWILRRDIYFPNDGECHSCWIWSK